MALKFLNKKGWHTGSLRNIENVWKAEQKHDAEQKKLEELRKQIQEERERSEFRLLQEQAGLVPKQERLEFLYDSGLAVGKGNSDGFKALEAFPQTNNDIASSSTKASVPGALFEEKPQSANDAWRKLHSDPLLMIRQREQEALARVKNNPVQMAMIRKSLEAQKHKEQTHDKRTRKKLHKHESKHHKSSSSKRRSESDNVTFEEEDGRKSGNYRSSEDKSPGRGNRRKKNHNNHKEQASIDLTDLPTGKGHGEDRINRKYDRSKSEKYSLDDRLDPDVAKREDRSFSRASNYDYSVTVRRHESHHKRRNIAPRLSEEERAARLSEMQADAELHDEQRYKRIRKAEEEDVREATRAVGSGGQNFLDAAQKSIYGAGKGGSSTIEESVRRRTHYLQGRSEAEGHAFRR